MRFLLKSNAIRLLGYLLLGSLYNQALTAQKVLGYGPDELTASVNYERALYGTYKKYYNSLPAYPVKGAYSPTNYSRYDVIPPGCGACNYIYIPTKGLLLPGHQYRITLTVKVGKAFSEVPYFQDYFGVALSSDLYRNNFFGLWNKPFVHLDIDTTESLVTKSFIFRPLCTSNYLSLGVFQVQAWSKKDCFLCQYGFELYNLLVEEYEDPNADFVYMCDAFEEKRLEKKYSTGYDTDTVYFESGSAEVIPGYLSILDSIPSKLRTKQDLVTLYGYTDKNGSANDALGAERNATVRKELVARGIDTARILTVNYGESKAADRVSQDDRRVEIDVNLGKLYQKYYTAALQSATSGNYKLAKVNIEKWAKMVPPEYAIYALFDCWGENEEAIDFKSNLLKSIKSRLYYKGNDLKFTLDSLSCEDQKGRALQMSLSKNRLPNFSFYCNYDIDSLRNESNKSMVDQLYSKYGFPTVKEFGERGNQVLPYIIIHANDTIFQNRYLPIVRKACEEQIIDWENYALLYDKICYIRNGHQRYGTQWKIDATGKLDGLIPLEDESKVAEYRKQVGLVPLSDF